MNNQEILDLIRTRFAHSILVFDEPYEMLTLEVKPDSLLPILTFLRDEETLQCGFLTDLCGVHYPEQAGRELGVVYLVHSWTKNIRIRLKCFVPKAKPEVPSIVSLYDAANWMERETYDFYGILFTGHPNLRRILNMDDMDYHPMRKEYALEDGTRTDKDDRYFGRDGNKGQEFDQRYIK